jgi:hypothetical protein
MRSDKVTFRKVVEAIAAEERNKQHKVLAEQLEDLLQSAPADRPSPVAMRTALTKARFSAIFRIVFRISKRLSARYFASRLLHRAEQRLRTSPWGPWTVQVASTSKNPVQTPLTMEPSLLVAV